MIKNVPYILGPLENNSYLIFDEDSRTAYVIDPSFDPQPILETIHQEQLTLKAILLTHAHFDHVAGISTLVKMLPAPIQNCAFPQRYRALQEFRRCQPVQLFTRRIAQTNQ